MLFNVFVLVVASEATAQERIDDWYGHEFTELHAQLKYSAANHGEKFKYRDHGNDKVSLTMIDYRNVKCEYVSLNGGLTVKYRVDHYTRKAYANRKESIHSKWAMRDGYYVLRNTVVAIFDDKSNSIGFGLLADMENNVTSSVDRKLGYTLFFSK